MHDGSADEGEGSGVYAIGGRAGGSSLFLDGGLGAFEPAAGNKSNMKCRAEGLELRTISSKCGNAALVVEGNR